MRTTLSQIRAHRPCLDGWQKLLRGLGKAQADDEIIWIDQILDINNLDDALWCLRAVENCDREIGLFGVWCARRGQHLMTDPRSVAALDVAERYARNEASDAELDAARTAAAAATARAAAARAAAGWAAEAAAMRRRWPAQAAAEAAATARAAAGGAADAAWARDTERAAQAEELRRICREMRENGR
jgi:hypothetical protein